MFREVNDAKQFFEGKGRVIQLKNVNATGMSWVGVPIVMFVNTLHSYMNPYSFNSSNTFDLDEKARIDVKATDRDAIRERIKFFEMTEQHRGKTTKDFPFNATDMARFILRVINGTLPDISDNKDEEEDIEFKQTPVPVLLSEMAYLKQMVIN